jgi:DNA (cytosine-5)-methyltransferase 1
MRFETTKDYPVISLFSGAGGLDTGFLRMGFRPVIAIDEGKAACETYRYNYPSVPVFRRDLSRIPKGYISRRLAELPQPVRPVGVIGGPPCQAFSLSNGNKKPNDPRAKLSIRYASLLSELNKTFELDFFVFENVPGIRNEKHIDQLRRIKRLFARAGFWVLEGELDAQKFGVAQIRRRVFIVGFNSKKYPIVEFDFPRGKKGPSKTVRDSIGHLPEPTYFSVGETNSISFHKNHRCMVPRSEKFRNGWLREGQIKGRPFRVLSWGRPSWTVAYGHREVHVHPSGHRRLSVYEAMLLQGFLKVYQLKGTLSDQIRLVSDAVPPPLAAALAQSIREALPRLQRLTEYHDHSKRVRASKVFWSSRQEVNPHQAPMFLKSFFSQYAGKYIRKFPWRKRGTKDFHLLVAEVLLVQTKAEDVARIWPLLIKKCPVPRALATAKTSVLRNLLRPLGLQNQRAEALHSISRALLKRHKGCVPRTVVELLSLPHVGLYTATAVASFCFGAKVPIVDTNVLRVLGRIEGIRSAQDLRRSKEIWRLAWSVLPEEKVDLHNYGILDFAATVCTRDPDCSHCPLRRKCKFGQERLRRGG